MRRESCYSGNRSIRSRLVSPNSVPNPVPLRLAYSGCQHLAIALPFPLRHSLASRLTDRVYMHNPEPLSYYDARQKLYHLAATSYPRANNPVKSRNITEELLERF